MIKEAANTGTTQRLTLYNSGINGAAVPAAAPSLTLITVGELQVMINNCTTKEEADLLRQLKLYVETNPSPERIYNDLLNKIEIVAKNESEYENWLRDNSQYLRRVGIKAPKIYYGKITGLTELKKRIATAEILLKISRQL